MFAGDGGVRACSPEVNTVSFEGQFLNGVFQHHHNGVFQRHHNGDLNGTITFRPLAGLLVSFSCEMERTLTWFASSVPTKGEANTLLLSFRA